MQANVFQSDFRMLNEDELVYKISNRKNVQFDSESSFDDIVNQLTPGRMEIALAAGRTLHTEESKEQFT